MLFSEGALCAGSHESYLPFDIMADNLPSPLTLITYKIIGQSKYYLISKVTSSKWSRVVCVR